MAGCYQNIKHKCKGRQGRRPLHFFFELACINFSYMIQYIRKFLDNRRKIMIKENIKNYDLDELKIKLENLRRKDLQSRANFPLDI